MTSSRFFAPTRPPPGAFNDGGLEARVRALLRDVRRCHRRRRRSRDAFPDGPDAPDDESRACAICLDVPRVPTTLGGCLPGAAHVFCLTCVERWSQSATVCPLCKRAFDVASYVDQDGISRRRQMAPKTLARTSTDEDDDDDEAIALALALEETLCEVCGSGEDEATMLLCDGCDAARHMACCVPPLREVPPGDWFCPACAAASEEEEDEASASDEGDGREEGGKGCLPARGDPAKPRDEREGRGPNGGASAANVTFEMFRFAR